eukprot:g5462.t1
MLLLVVSLYNCYMIPLRLAFAKPLQYSLWIYAADYSLDLIIIADVIMRSRIFGFLVDGQLQTEPRLILKNFHNKWQCASEDKTVAYRSLMKNYSFTNYSACKWDHTWIEKQFAEDLLPADKDNGMWAFYVRCINWALPTLVVVVIGDVVPVNGGETLYAFICMLVGMVINAMIIGNIANIVAGSDSPAVRLKKRIYALNKFMRGQQLPETARNRVHKFFQESGTANVLLEVDGGSFKVSVVSEGGCCGVSFLSDDEIKIMVRVNKHKDGSMKSARHYE